MKKKSHPRRQRWPLRKFFFYSLVLMFFILLPVIILYALGYRWDPAHRALTRSGLVVIKTYPEEAAVSVNGRWTQKKTPATLSLLPGRYEIDLELKGYLPYAKTVTVEPNRVTRLENTVFFSKVPKFKSFLIPQTAQNFYLAPSRKRALFIARESEKYIFYIFHMGDKTFRELSVLPADRGLDLKRCGVLWSLEEDVLLVHSPGLSLLLFTRRPRSSYFLRDVLGYEPKVLKFSERLSPDLYLLNQGRIVLFDVKGKKVKAEFLKEVADFEPTRLGFLWLKERSADIYRSLADGGMSRKTASLKNFAGGAPLIWQSSGKPFFIFEGEKRAVQDRQGNFWILDPPTYQAGVRGFHLSPSGKKALVWTDYELWLFELARPQETGGGSQKFIRRLIFESEIPLQTAFFAPDENYAFFLTHRKLYAIELETEGGVNLYPFYVSQTPILPNAWAVDEEEGLFYWITSHRGEKQLRVLRLTVGFFEPFVERLTGMKEEMEMIREKIQSSPFMRSSEKGSR